MWNKSLKTKKQAGIMKSNKILIGISALLYFSVDAGIRRIDSNSDEVRGKIEQMGKLFAETSSTTQQGPDIGRLQNRAITFLAKYDLFGFARYFEFETQDDADALQLGCYNGGAMSVKWYYIPTP